MKQGNCAQLSIEDDALTKVMKPLMENLANLTKQVQELQTRPARQPYRQYRPPKCKPCVTKLTDALIVSSAALGDILLETVTSLRETARGCRDETFCSQSSSVSTVFLL